MVKASAEGSILVLNVGSSTLKFGLFRVAGGDESTLSGTIEYSRPADGRLTIIDRAGSRTPVIELHASREDAPGEVLRYLRDESLLESVEVVGHRLVHGGAGLREPVRVSSDVRRELEQVIPLAPDHLPIELRAIDEISRVAPELVQVASFDTAFHSRMPRVARLFALPRTLSDSGVMRYGFHGLSYEYISDTLRQRGKLRRRTIVAHLGNGASMAALLDGVSVDTSMGLTPAGGLPMSTRSGDIDPGVMLYLLNSRDFSVQELDAAVNARGGLLGISASSSDMRELLAAEGTDTRAAEAVEVFCYQARKYIGAHAAALGGIDALVFTGGIGERSPQIRSRICEKLAFLGLRIQPELNERNAPLISTDGSDVEVHAIKTDEQAMIARHVRRVLGHSQHPV
jgi:acetate kinase